MRMEKENDAAMEMAEVIMNPTHQRILQYLMVYETGTVKEIKNALPDIPGGQACTGISRYWQIIL